MRMRFLGKTGLLVSELCVGTANFGATGVYEASGRIEQAECDRIVSLALDSGVNFFNTAERYSYGIAETMFGQALGKRRKEAIVITKINPARTPGPNDGGLSRKHVIEGCEASLKRLGTDYIDIYQIHEFDAPTLLEVTIRAMDDLVRAGKVRYIGCSNFVGWQLMKSLAISEKYGWEKFATIESMYSLANRSLEFEVVPVCLDQGVALIPWSPLHGGYLTGKYRRNKPLPEGARFKSMDDPFWETDTEMLFDIVDELEKVARAHDATISQAALNYLLRKPAVGSLIVGMRRIEQFAENLKATEWEMTDDEFERLDKVSQPRQGYPYYVYDPEKEAAAG